MPVSVSLELDRGRAPFSPLSRVSLHDFFSLLCLDQLVLLTPSFPLPQKSESLFLDVGKDHG